MPVNQGGPDDELEDEIAETICNHFFPTWGPAAYEAAAAKVREMPRIQSLLRTIDDLKTSLAETHNDREALLRRVDELERKLGVYREALEIIRDGPVSLGVDAFLKAQIAEHALAIDKGGEA